MDVINRTALYICPNDSYLEWANSVAQTNETLDNMKQTCKIVLLPISCYVNQKVFIENHYREFFEMELESWVPERKLWPVNIDFPLFMEWFDIEFYALVVDFIDDPISKESFSGLGI